jgi:hypothetical protein
MEKMEIGEFDRDVGSKTGRNRKLGVRKDNKK